MGVRKGTVWDLLRIKRASRVGGLKVLCPAGNYAVIQ